MDIFQMDIQMGKGFCLIKMTKLLKKGFGHKVSSFRSFLERILHFLLLIN